MLHKLDTWLLHAIAARPKLKASAHGGCAKTLSGADCMCRIKSADGPTLAQISSSSYSASSFAALRYANPCRCITTSSAAFKWLQRLSREGTPCLAATAAYFGRTSADQNYFLAYVTVSCSEVTQIQRLLLLDADVPEYWTCHWHLHRLGKPHTRLYISCANPQRHRHARPVEQ